MALDAYSGETITHTTTNQRTGMAGRSSRGPSSINTNSGYNAKAS
jgi:hypothetical protein